MENSKKEEIDYKYISDIWALIITHIFWERME